VTAKTKDSCRLDRLVRVDGALKNSPEINFRRSYDSYDFASHGTIHPDHPDHPDQDRESLEFFWSGWSEESRFGPGALLCKPALKHGLLPAQEMTPSSMSDLIKVADAWDKTRRGNNAGTYIVAVAGG
jgi:hypothetical protein